MDLTSLRAVLGELRAPLLPSRFEKAQQSDAHSVQLGLRRLDGLQWLELSWLAEAPRLVTIAAPRRQGDGSTLAQQLQHGLRGLALVSLGQRGWERVVELGFASRPAEPVQRTLLLELMGRHSNLFLLDGERRVIALARQVRSGQSRLRPIGTGDLYQPPPALTGEPPRRLESQESWRRRLTLLPVSLRRALMEVYQGIGPALVQQLCADLEPSGAALPDQLVTELSEAQWHGLWSHWQAWLSALEEERFALQWGGGSAYRCWTPERRDGRDAPAGRLLINRGLASYYGARLAERSRDQRRRALLQRLLSAAERERRQASQQQELLEAVPSSDGLQQRADALLCLRAPSRDQIDEAQALYRKARKLRRSVAAITPRLELHRQRLDSLETSLTFLEQAEESLSLEALEEELEELIGGATQERPGHRRPRRRASGSPSGGPSGAGGAGGGTPPQPLELLSASGLLLQVGRNHRQNEWISLRQARRGDLWFHAQEIPGSHVVLKGSVRPPAEADLAAAADLAAHFSRGRGNRRVPVVMVATEALQRIPGALPGTVRHRGGTVLWGEPERARALLAQTPPPQAP